MAQYTQSALSHHSVHFSRSVISESLRPHEPQHATPPCPSPTASLLKSIYMESAMPSNHLILCCPLPLLPSIFPSIRVFSNKLALHIRWPNYWSFNLSICPSNEYSGLISFLLTGLIPYCPRDSQKSSPALQFESINSLAFSLLYGTTLTSVHDYWKNHSFD